MDFEKIEIVVKRMRQLGITKLSLEDIAIELGPPYVEETEAPTEYVSEEEKSLDKGQGRKEELTPLDIPYFIKSDGQGVI